MIKVLGDNNNDGLRLEEITVHLYANGQYYAADKVNAKDGWTYDYTYLERYDNQNN